MRPPTRTAAGVSRAELTRALIRCSSGFGRDLVELTMLYRPTDAGDLWDRFGAIDVYPWLDLRTLRVTDPDLRRRCYYQAAQTALTRMMLHGLRDRAGTHFRWAAAMLEELTTQPVRRASPTWRALATESRYVEWRDRCDPVYQSAIEACRELACEASIEIAQHIRDIRAERGERVDVLSWLRSPIVLPVVPS